jgi:hypothetical protein
MYKALELAIPFLLGLVVCDWRYSFSRMDSMELAYILIEVLILVTRQVHHELHPHNRSVLIVKPQIPTGAPTYELPKCRLWAVFF